MENDDSDPADQPATGKLTDETDREEERMTYIGNADNKGGDTGD